MTKALNLIGSVIGNWTVLSLHSSAPRRYLCRCTCGVEKDVSSSNLQSGQSTGCGHDKAERVRISKIKHGALANGKKHPLYNAWRAMLSRCTNPKNAEYRKYGGRGIMVCEAWMNFHQFVADMGPKPTPQHSIDRFPDNNGNYEPENCRWATKGEQSGNRRTNRDITHNGRTMCLAHWAQEVGMVKETLVRRLNCGMPFGDAISLPLSPKGRYERREGVRYGRKPKANS